MKFKLDENFGRRCAELLSAAGHDAETVIQEGLGGAPDETIFEVCIQEQRCLLTLDLDFSDVLRFPPHKSAGIAVIRLPKGVSQRLLETMISSFLSMATNQPITGRLWIIESGRIRVHENTSPNSN